MGGDRVEVTVVGARGLGASRATAVGLEVAPPPGAGAGGGAQLTRWVMRRGDLCGPHEVLEFGSRHAFSVDGGSAGPLRLRVFAFGFGAGNSDPRHPDGGTILGCGGVELAQHTTSMEQEVCCDLTGHLHDSDRDRVAARGRPWGSGGSPVARGEVLLLVKFVGGEPSCRVELEGAGGAGEGTGAALPPRGRPAPEARTLRSEAVDATVADLSPRLRPALGVLFENCYPNTLDTTVAHLDGDDGFVITGDIPAMWLRDSTNQLLPYTTLLAGGDPTLKALFVGVLRRQARSVLLDGYGNAFNFDGRKGSGQEHQGDFRQPPMQPAVFEGKWEVDSLASFLRLGRAVWEAGAGGAEVFDEAWARAVGRVIDVFVEQQAGTLEELGAEAYTFARNTTVASDTRAMAGRGAMALRCGLIKSAFRPSDDATVLPFLVPANCMAAVELKGVAEVLSATGRHELADRAARLGSSVEAAVATLAVLPEPAAPSEAASGMAQVYAYEVDGYGNALHMDDANAPSLLSLPFLGFVDASDPVYQATRRRVLSRANPFFFESTDGMFAGVGSLHTGPGRIWPLSLIIQALTSDDETEIAACLHQLEAAAAEKGFMHEAFSAADPADFSRPWFAWANGLFGQLVLRLAASPPHLVLRPAAPAGASPAPPPGPAPG